MRADRLLIVASLLGLWLANATVAAAPGAAVARHAPCIGLVLGGGGARGAAHIGVLQVLEREHIPVCRISGTSMGSIVGGLYAAGYTPDEMAKIVTTLDWTDVLSDDPARPEKPMRRKDDDYRYLLNFEVGYKNGRIITPAGVVQGQKLLLFLRRLLLSTWNVDDFDQLTIPFRAVATDIVAGKPVVFSHGDLPLVIRSSMSVPGAFAPTNVNGQLLVDGGLMDNVPIDVARSMGAQRLIVVDVGSPLADEAELSNPVALLNQMVSALMAEKTQRQLATLGPGDILIRPALGKFSASAFDQAEKAIAIGRAAAEAMLPQLRALRASPERWQAYEATRHQRAFDPALVAFLSVDPGRTRTAPYVHDQLSGLVDKPFDADALEDQIGKVYGRGNYQQIDYHLDRQDDRLGIRITPVDKPWGPVYGKLGFQLDDDFNGRSEYLISAEITATNLNSYGAEWRSILWAGRIGGAATEFFQPLGHDSDFYVQPMAQARNEDLPIFSDDGDRQLAEYRVLREFAGAEFGWSPESTWRVLGSLTRGYDKGLLRVGSPTSFPNQRSDYAFGRVGFDWDSLDDAQFPTRGAHVELSYDMYRHFLGGQVDADVARLTADWIPDWGLSSGRYHLLLGLRANSALDDAQFIETQNFLGGFLNLSGYSERALYGSQSALGRVVLYRRTGKMDAIFSTPLYVGASLEAGNTWHARDQVDASSLIYGGSLFVGLQSPLGPVFLGYGYAAGGHNAVYLTFGSLLRPQP